MNNFVRFLLLSLGFLLAAYWGYNYGTVIVQNGDIPQLLVSAAVILVVGWLLVRGFKTGVFAIAMALMLSSCNGCQKAPSNQLVLTTSNWGKDWRLLGPAETIPYCNLPGCYNIHLPRTLLVGEMITNQRLGATPESARVTFDISYQYEISDPIKFITKAKGLQNSSSELISDAAIEAIENRLLNNEFRKVLGRLSSEKSMDILTFDVVEFQKTLQANMETVIVDFGINLTGLNVVLKYGQQLESAIDVINALAVYKQIGIEEFGRAVMLAKAVASQVSIDNGISNNAAPAEHHDDKK